MARVWELANYLKYPDLVSRGMIPDLISIIKTTLPVLTSEVKYPPSVVRTKSYPFVGMISDLALRKALATRTACDVVWGLEPVANSIQLATALTRYRQAATWQEVFPDIVQIAGSILTERPPRFNGPEVIAWLTPFIDATVAQYQPGYGCQLRYNQEVTISDGVTSLAGHPDIMTEMAVLEIKTTNHLEKYINRAVCQVMAYYAMATATNSAIKYISLVLPLQGRIIYLNMEGYNPAPFRQELLGLVARLPKTIAGINAGVTVTSMALPPLVSSPSMASLAALPPLMSSPLAALAALPPSSVASPSFRTVAQSLPPLTPLAPLPPLSSSTLNQLPRLAPLINGLPPVSSPVALTSSWRQFLNSSAAFRSFPIGQAFVRGQLTQTLPPLIRDSQQSLAERGLSGPVNLQTFLYNPVPGVDNPAYKTLLTKEVVRDVKNILTSSNTNLFIHAPYGLNICNPLGFRYRDNKPFKNPIATNLSKATKMGCRGLVIHTGFILNATLFEALNMAETNIRSALVEATVGCPVLLETPAGRTGEPLPTVEEFRQFLNRFTPSERTLINVCLDTAHVWGAGYDPVDYLKLWAGYDARDGVIPIRVVHFNDSPVAKGSHIDRHALPGVGIIPVASLVTIAQWAVSQGIPMIHE